MPMPMMSAADPLRHAPEVEPRAREAVPQVAAALAPHLVQLLDAAALARLQALDPSGKSGLMQRVLATFESSLRRLLGELLAARARDDTAALGHVAHTLKSSSASVGALQLSALCADIELRLRDGPFDGLPTRLDAMVAEAERVLNGLQTPVNDTQ